MKNIYRNQSTLFLALGIRALALVCVMYPLTACENESQSGPNGSGGDVAVSPDGGHTVEDVRPDRDTQADDETDLPSGSSVWFHTKDRFVIGATAYYPAPLDGDTPYPQPLPVAVLLHDRMESRSQWEMDAPGLVTALRREGFFMLVVDLRGHMESKIRLHRGEAGHKCRDERDCKAGTCEGGICPEYSDPVWEVDAWEEVVNVSNWGAEDWREMGLDCDAAAMAVDSWVQEGHPLDRERIVFVGAGVGANSVLRYGADESSKAKALALVSPFTNGPDRTTASEFEVLAGHLQCEAFAVGAAEHLYGMRALEALGSASASGASVQISTRPGPLFGVPMLGLYPDLQRELILWLVEMARL